MYTQTAPKLLIKKNQLSIKNNDSTFNTLTVFKGHLLENELSGATQIMGKIITKEAMMHFIPIVPFGWNQEYTLFYNNTVEYFTIDLPKKYKHLAIEAVHPSGDKLPSNILKWYIKFSKPISETHVYENIIFKNADDKTLDRAILPIENALLTNNGRLLTVWIDPGRQKRNLLPNQQLGSVFEENKTYTLVILKKLKDKQGVTMLQDFEHQFRIIAPDRIQPNINHWKIKAPKTNTMSNLVINFKESLDYGSALNQIRVQNAQKKEIEGTLKLIDKETSLIFTPNKHWAKGNYFVTINTILEDLAGNNLDRLFDTEIKEDTDHQINIKEHTLEFSIK